MNKKKKSATAGRLLYLVLVCSFIAGCSTMSMTDEDYQPPELRLVSITKMPTGNFEQGFELGFKIINPNDQALRAKGMVFSVELEGYELIKGVHNRIPEVKPYSEIEFSAKASINVINSIRFFNELVTQNKNSLSYRLDARVDAKKGGVKSFKEKREGTISLAM